MYYWQKQDVSASFYDLLIFDWIFPSSITSTEEEPYLVNSYNIYIKSLQDADLR